MMLSNQATELSNSDLYSGYNEYDPLLDSKNLQFDQRFQQAVLLSSYGDRNRTAGNPTTGLLTSRKSRAGSRRGTTFNQPSIANLNSNSTNRPVTAVRAAGYTRSSSLTATGYRQDTNFSHGKLFDPLGQQTRLNSSTASKQDEDEFVGLNKTKNLQLKVQQLYQESVLAAQRSDYTLALKKSRDCITKERSLQKHLQQTAAANQTADNSNSWSSLKWLLAVQVNLAVQLANNKLFSDAINVYQSIVKNKQLNENQANSKLYLTGRFKCNIGLIYYAEGKYQKAIKFFRMALDQISDGQQDFRMKIMRNIAFCFIRMGRYSDALSSFDYILVERPIYVDAFRLIVCNYALKDVTGMKTSYLKLLELRSHLYEHSSLNYFLTSTGKANAGKEFNNQKEFNEMMFDSLADSYDEDEEDDLTELNDSNAGHTLDKLSNRKTTSQSPSTKARSAEDDANLLLKRAIRNDLLSIVHNRLTKQRNWCILTASKLIAGEIANEIENGFIWCAFSIKRLCTGTTTDLQNLITSASTIASTDLHSQQTNVQTNLDLITNDLKSFSFTNSSRLADELIADLQLACAELYLLKKRQLEPAIKILKVFEQSLSSSANKRLWTAKCSALTNLAYIYLLQKQITLAHSYLDQVLEFDHLNIGALVNKGCCYFLEDQLDHSREYFSEALLNEPNCISAIYNLALLNKRAGRLGDSLDLLFRLNNLITENEFCMYQIANIFLELKDRDQALDWYEQLLSKESSDVYLLNKIGDLFDAFTYLNESYRQNPAHIPTLERLAAHYIETKVYEKAIHYLKQASNIEPRKIKWLLMIAACYIRSNNYQQAINYYRLAHRQFPQNLDCLKHLFRLSEELNLLDEQIVYAEKIAKLEKANEQRERRVQSGGEQQHNSASSTSSFQRIQQSAKLRNDSANSNLSKRLNRSNSKFSLNDEAGSRVNEASNLFSTSSSLQMTNNKKSKENSNDLKDTLFSFENQLEDQRPMTGVRQASAEQANDFTTDIIKSLERYSLNLP